MRATPGLCLTLLQVQVQFCLQQRNAESKCQALILIQFLHCLPASSWTGLKSKRPDDCFVKYCNGRTRATRVSIFAGRRKAIGSLLEQSKSLRRSAVHSLSWIYLIHQNEPPFSLVCPYLYECALGQTSVVQNHSYRKEPSLYVKV